MIRLILAITLCITIVGDIAAENGVKKTTGLKSGVFDPPRMAPDFSLPSSRDNQFTLREQRGKLLCFNYRPIVCPRESCANL